jgi:hypothetical protein
MKSKDFAEDLEGHTNDLKEEYERYEKMAEEDLND